MNDTMSEHTDALNAAVTDDQIADAIDSQGAGGDHPDSVSVAEVRETLAFLAESADEVWGSWVDNIEHNEATVVAETDSLILVDIGEANHVVDEELNTMAYEGRLDREGQARTLLANVITNLMHKIAGDISDRNWPATYPWVLPKPDSDGRAYVEAVINGLQKRGLSPGQAWAYYGVELKSESQSSWARRQDRNQQQISKALKKAREKLPR